MNSLSNNYLLTQPKNKLIGKSMNMIQSNASMIDAVPESRTEFPVITVILPESGNCRGLWLFKYWTKRSLSRKPVFLNAFIWAGIILYSSPPLAKKLGTATSYTLKASYFKIPKITPKIASNCFLNFTTLADMRASHAVLSSSVLEIHGSVWEIPATGW